MAYPPKPVVIYGVEYPSHRRASLVLGIPTSTLSEAVKRGRLDRVGKNPRNKPITILGTEYRCVKEAAYAIGVCTNTIYTAKKKGTLDRVGISKLWRNSR